MMYEHYLIINWILKKKNKIDDNPGNIIMLPRQSTCKNIVELLMKCSEYS